MSAVVAKLVLWIEGQPSPLFINYDDIQRMHMDANKVTDRRGWVQFGTGDKPVAFEDYIWAGSVSRYRMEVFG